MNRGATPIWITVIIIGGMVVIGETAIIADYPGSAPLIISVVTTLSGVGVSTFATLRALFRNTQETKDTKQSVEKMREGQTIIARNVNGNMSRLLDFARSKGMDQLTFNEVAAEVERLKKLAKDENG